MVYTLFVWLFSLNIIIILRLMHVVLVLRVYSFLLLNTVPLYGYTIMCLFIHLLMNIWVVSNFGLLQKIQSFYKHSWTNLCVDICFCFSWVDNWEWNGWVCGRCLFIFLRSPTAVHESSNCSTYWCLLILVIVSLFKIF